MTLNKIGVFRKQYLPISETFVAAQGYGLRSANLEPVFIGLRRAKAGLHHVAPEDFVSLSSSPLDYKIGRATIAVNETLRGGKVLPKRWVQRARETGVQLIHSHFGHTGMVGVELARQLNVPHVVTFHGHDIAPTDLSGDYLARLPKLWHDSDCIIAVSEHIRRRLIDRGAPAEKIKVHYIGIDTAKFTQKPSPRSEHPTVLFVGRLVGKKGVGDLVEAMLLVQQKMPTAELIVIGDGPEAHKIDSATERGLKVTMLGSQPPDRVQQELNRCWVFCGPSCAATNGDEEGLGMVFLEAQACATPVVSCTTGGIPEAVKDGETGFLAPPKSPAELSDALITLLSDNELRTNMGKSGNSFIAEKFDVKKQCIELANIYRSVSY